MLRHVRLNEHGAAIRIKSGGKPIHKHFDRVLLYLRSVGVISSESMPIRDKEETVELVLHAHPVVERADKVSQVQLARRPHAAQYAFRLSSRGHYSRTSTELNALLKGKMSRPSIPRPR